MPNDKSGRPRPRTARGGAATTGGRGRSAGVRKPAPNGSRTSSANGQRMSARTSSTPGAKGGQSAQRSAPTPTRGTRPAARGTAQRATHRAGVYRRRRVVVAVIALLILTGLIFGVMKLAPMVTEMISALGIGSPEAPAVAPHQDEAPDEHALANPVECLPDAVTMAIGLDAASALAGSEVPVNVTLTNGGRVPCLLDTGHRALSVVITSGTDQVWTTAHCPAGPAQRLVLLDIGATETRQIVWNGSHSKKGCPADGSTAKAGTYQIDVSITLAEADVTEQQALVLG